MSTSRYILTHNNPIYIPETAEKTLIFTSQQHSFLTTTRQKWLRGMEMNLSVLQLYFSSLFLLPEIRRQEKSTLKLTEVTGWPGEGRDQGLCNRLGTGQTLMNGRESHSNRGISPTPRLLLRLRNRGSDDSKAKPTATSGLFVFYEEPPP